MNSCFIRLLLVAILLAGTPHMLYAAFPVARIIENRNNAAEVYTVCNGKSEYYADTIINKTAHPDKNKTKCYKSVSIALAAVSILLGGLGLHRVYMGYEGIGTAQLFGIVFGLLSMVFIFIAFFAAPAIFYVLGIVFAGLWGASLLWQISDLVRICAGSLKPKSGNFAKYKKVPKTRLGWGNDN